MTGVRLAREIAKRSTPRFVSIPPKRGPHVRDAMCKLIADNYKAVSAVLEGELMRLIELWESSTL
jgi:hypothetical protein